MGIIDQVSKRQDSFVKHRAAGGREELDWPKCPKCGHHMVPLSKHTGDVPLVFVAWRCVNSTCGYEVRSRGY